MIQPNFFIKRHIPHKGRHEKAHGLLCEPPLYRVRRGLCINYLLLVRLLLGVEVSWVLHVYANAMVCPTLIEK